MHKLKQFNYFLKVICYDITNRSNILIYAYSLNYTAIWYFYYQYSQSHEHNIYFHITTHTYIFKYIHTNIFWKIHVMLLYTLQLYVSFIPCGLPEQKKWLRLLRSCYMCHLNINRIWYWMCEGCWSTFYICFSLDNCEYLKGIFFWIT